VDGDLVACSRRDRSSATSNDLSFDTHYEVCWLILEKETKRIGVMSTRGSDSYFSFRVERFTTVTLGNFGVILESDYVMI
jgi:hypothetical protein